MSSCAVTQSKHFKNLFNIALVCFSIFALTSCDLAANYNKADRAANAETQDFRDALAERDPEIDSKNQNSTAAGDIPQLQPYISTETSAIKPMPLVSVSVNQSVPLRDTLFELAEQAGYDIELDPRIKGSIILTARNKPFDDVVYRICDMAGLRAKIDDNTVRVELDEPYNKIYKIDYLSIVRNNSGSVNTSVSVVSGGGTDTGSNYAINAENTSDFWTEMELNLKQILGGATTGAMKTKVDPKISSVEKKSKKKDSKKDEKDSKDSDGEDKTKETENKSKDDESEDEDTEAVLNVDSLPVDAEITLEEGDKDKKDGEATFTINKQAGILNVYANEKAHKQVEAYLKELKRSVSAQVLIEAKVFEVALNDEYITGIDWGALDIGNGFVGFMNENGRTAINTMLDGTALHVAPPTSAAVVDAANLTIGYAGGDVQALVTAISGFGTVRALASPRITVMNNQAGVLNVATNNVYFELSVDTSYDADTGVRNTDITSAIKSVPEGVLINVQPSVNVDGKTIDLSVRPTVSRITGYQADPAVAFVVASVPDAAGIESNIPELNVQEIDTVIKVKSGQPVVMGGLLQDRTSSTREGVPVLGELPVVGAAFRKHTDLVRKTELVIFLKATIMDSGDDTVTDTDRDIYRKLSGDRRPLKL